MCVTGCLAARMGRVAAGAETCRQIGEQAAFILIVLTVAVTAEEGVLRCCRPVQAHIKVVKPLDRGGICEVIILQGVVPLRRSIVGQREGVQIIHGRLIDTPLRDDIALKRRTGQRIIDRSLGTGLGSAIGHQLIGGGGGNGAAAREQFRVITGAHQSGGNGLERVAARLLLAQSLIIAEHEELILYNRTAQGATKLCAMEG